MCRGEMAEFVSVRSFWDPLFGRRVVVSGRRSWRAGLTWLAARVTSTGFVAAAYQLSCDVTNQLIGFVG